LILIIVPEPVPADNMEIPLFKIALTRDAQPFASDYQPGGDL
jgi:hypothetical protein